MPCNHGPDSVLTCGICTAEKYEADLAALRKENEKLKAAVLTARADGRAEFFMILVQSSAETFESDCIKSYPIADTGDYGQAWREDELRKLFEVDDKAWSLITSMEDHNLTLHYENCELKHALEEKLTSKNYS